MPHFQYLDKFLGLYSAAIEGTLLRYSSSVVTHTLLVGRSSAEKTAAMLLGSSIREAVPDIVIVLSFTGSVTC